MPQLSQGRASALRMFLRLSRAREEPAAASKSRFGGAWRGFLFRFSFSVIAAGFSYGVNRDAGPLARSRVIRVNRLALGFLARAGSRGGIAYWSGRWRAAPADFFFGFRRRLELRGRPRPQPDRALAGFPR